MSGGQPSVVAIPPQFAGKFKQLGESKVYVWKLVDKVNSQKKREQKVLVVTDRHIFLFNLDGNITRVARLSDVEKAARSENSKTICIKFYQELFEPTLMLQLRTDPRNPPTSDIFTAINFFRQMQRNGEELPTPTMMDNESQRPTGFGPWEKPHAYAPPEQKIKESRKYLWKGSVRPAAANPSPQNQRASPGMGFGSEHPEGQTFRPGQSVQLARLGDEYAHHNGLGGVILEYEEEYGKYKVAFPHPVDMQSLSPKDLDPCPYEVDPRSVAREFLVDAGELGLVFQDDCMIHEVEEGKPAHRAGIPAGRKIVAINHKRLESRMEVKEEHDKVKTGSYIVTISGEMPDYYKEDEEDMGGYGSGGDVEELEKQLEVTRMSLQETHRKLREAQGERDQAVEHVRNTRERLSQANKSRRGKRRPLESHLGELLLRHIDKSEKHPSSRQQKSPQPVTRLGPYRSTGSASRRGTPSQGPYPDEVFSSSSPKRFESRRSGGGSRSPTDPLVSAIIHSTRYGGGDPELFTSRRRPQNLESLSAIL